MPIAGKRGRITRAIDDVERFETFIPSACVQNHAANLMSLDNGDLGCVWFGGTQVGMADISVYFSRLKKDEDSWSFPEKLSDDPQRSEQNPILFPAPDGRLWLLWTAQKFGNQDTAIVRFRISEDNGYSWGPIGTLFGTKGRCGTSIRQPLVVLDNGDWLLPIFYCQGAAGKKWVGDDDTSAVKISSNGGRSWSEYEVPNSTGCVHMNVEKLSDGRLLALFRSRWADNIYESRSSDNGRTWSEPTPTQLPNNNSSIQFTRLSNNHLALVFNDVNRDAATERRTSLYDEIEDPVAEGGDEEALSEAVAGQDSESQRAFWGVPRAPMTIAISEDNGRTWARRRNLEIGDGYCMSNSSRDKTNREYSYPTVKQTPDGAIQIAFTYYRQAIKYVRVTEDWVQDRLSK
jgi:predicted neuraminidase